MNNFCTFSSPEQSIEESCDVLIQRFWESVEISQAKLLSAEEKFTRNEQGRYYVVRLPFRHDEKDLGYSTDAMERKCRKDPEYNRQYAHFMTEYQDLDQESR